MERLDEKISQLLMGLPQDLKDAVLLKVELYKSKRPAFSDKEIYFEAKDLVELEMVAYLDRRDYLKIYNRRFLEHILKEKISDLVAKEESTEDDLFGMARVHFDMNGLKALNDLAGHEAGNHGLSIIADILKQGKTTRWLESLGYHVSTAAEGGDEFGIVAMGAKDIRPHIDAIRDGYTQEVEHYDASALIDFTDSKVKESLAMLGISDEIPKDFMFKLSTSCGIVTFGEALGVVDVHEVGKTYDEIVSAIVGAMFKLSDERAREHKAAYKEELGKTNPVLSGLYARMSREVIHLEREVTALREELKKLKGE